MSALRTGPNVSKWRKADPDPDNHSALPALHLSLSKSVDQNHHFRLDSLR